MTGIIKTIKNHVLKSCAEYCTADYGTREPDYATHHGMDFVNANGGACEVIAIADGEVVHIQDGVKGYSDVLTAGNYVKLRHENGYCSRYLHLAPDSICVKVGDKVKAGQVLGMEGGTGYCIPREAVHLHFDIHNGMDYTDPLPYLTGEKTLYKSKPSACTVGIGDRVFVKPGARFSDGRKPFDFVYKTEYDVQQISKDGKEALIGIDDEHTGWMFIKELIAIDCNRIYQPKIEVGDTVKVKPGALSYHGKQLASFVYTNRYEVMQIGIIGADDYVVIGQHGDVTASLHASDLVKI